MIINDNFNDNFYGFNDTALTALMIILTVLYFRLNRTVPLEFEKIQAFVSVINNWLYK